MFDSPAPTASLCAVDSVMKPHSVVVIGASPEGRGFTSAPIRNLKRHGFTGDIYAVNPKYDEIDGVPCFDSVSDIPNAPDAAVVVVAAERVPAVLADCARSGVKNATVVAGGFAELGTHGLTLEKDIRETCAESGLRLIGPNTAGLLNVVDSYVPRAGLNHPAHLTPGSVAIATQSGALCNTVLNRVQAYGQGVSMAVATGSQWDLDLWDFVDYFLADDRTSAVLAIPEAIHDVGKFLVTARRAIELGKPIVLLKPGRSEVGTKAIQTHSGALAGSVDLQVSIMRDNGVVVVDDLDELWEAGQLFGCWPVDAMPDAAEGRLAVLTYSGGDGALAADTAELAGLTCPRPSTRTVELVEAQFTLATPGNPFDYTGEVVAKPELIGPATEAFLGDEVYDVVLIAAPVWSSHFASWILGPAVETAAASTRPVAVSLWSAGEHTAEAQAVVREHGLPLFDGSHRAVRAIGRYFEFVRSRRRLLAELAVPGDAVPRRSGPTRMLDYWESRRVLGLSGVPFNEARAVETVDAAVEASTEVGFPVTLKISSELAVHKASAGGIRLFVRDVPLLRWEAAQLLDSFPGGALVIERFVPGSAMVLVGGHCDPDFGPVVVFGLGGGYAEAYGDVAQLQCPATTERVATALAATTFGRMLGQASSVFMKVADMVTNVADWFAKNPQVRSFDINPILVDLDGELVAVDARVEVVH